MITLATYVATLAVTFCILAVAVLLDSTMTKTQRVTVLAVCGIPTIVVAVIAISSI